MVILRDTTGDVALRDPGATWTTVVLDTLGDGMPEGEVLDETVDLVSGQQPLFEMDEVTFRSVVHDLIG